MKKFTTKINENQDIPMDFDYDESISRLTTYVTDNEETHFLEYMSDFNMEFPDSEINGDDASQELSSELGNLDGVIEILKRYNLLEYAKDHIYFHALVIQESDMKAKNALKYFKKLNQ